MEADMANFQQQPLQRRLTKMYSDTKRSYESVAEPPRPEVASELSSLHRKLQIQKTRLIVWGLEWSDRSSTAALSGDIDESLEREGLSEVVGTVLSQIKDILAEAERMRYPNSGGLKEQTSLVGTQSARSEKAMLEDYWAASDKPRFEDLLKDLTTSIDTLHELTRSRRDSGQGHPHRREPAGYSLKGSGPFASRQPGYSYNVAKAKESGFEDRSDSGLQQSSTRSPQTLRLDYSSLVIPEDSSSRPPPYEAIASPSNPRMMAFFRRSLSSSHPWNKDGPRIPTVPVLIDYAAIDPVYHDTGIYPSLSRLERLVTAIDQSAAAMRTSPNGSLNLLGYFEDPKNPRYGLVYELPQTVYSGPSDRERSLESMAPCSLLSLLQAKSTAGNSTTPALDDRFRLAHNLSIAFARLHSAGVFHRDVTSNSIVFFRSAPNALRMTTQRDPAFDIRNPYLTSFELFTEYSFQPPLSTPSPADIYRHPQDARLGGRDVFKEYTPSLDLYGLGLILLEIGLWMPLSCFKKNESNSPTLKASTLSTLVKKLGARCGTTYMRAVDACLSIVDRENASSEPGQYDNVFSNFHWEVVDRLDRCCMIEEGEARASVQGVLGPTASASVQPEGSLSKASLRAFEQSWVSKEPPRLANSPIKSKEPPPPTEPLPSQKASPQPSATLSKPKERTASNTSSWLPFDRFLRRGNTVPNMDEHEESVQEPEAAKSASELVSRNAVSSEVKERETQEKPQQRSREQTQATTTGNMQGSSSGGTRMFAVKISQAQLDEWHTNVLPRAEILLGKALKNVSETFTIDLVGLGKSSQTARPTIMVQCSSPKRIRAIFDRYFEYDQELFGLNVRRGTVGRSAAKKPLKREKRTGPARSIMHSDDDEPEPKNPGHFQRPLNGASIGVFKDGEHSLAVTYGGVVMVDGRPHGMTVHHMLEPPSDEENEEDSGYEDDVEEDEGETQRYRNYRSSARPRHLNLDQAVNRPPPWTWKEPYEGVYISDYSEEEEEADFDSEEEAQNDYEFRHDQLGPREDETNSIDTVGDTVGVREADGEDYLVTQPALHDMPPGHYPSLDDQDDEHLDTCLLGNVFASSGIRRWKQDGVYHEIDWALFRIKEDRLQPHNVIQGGKRFCAYSEGWNKRPALISPVCRNDEFNEDDDLFPNRIAPVRQLAGLEVHSVGRSTGLQRGVISPAMSAVKVAGRTSSSRSWHVVGDFGIPGDSGAWVIDNEQGRLCGHVLAWSQEKSIAYICPMQILFEDMERTLSRRITLPDAPENARVLTASNSSVLPTSNIPGSISPARRARLAIPPSLMAPPVEPKTIQIHSDPMSFSGAGGSSSGLGSPVGNLRLSSPPPAPPLSPSGALHSPMAERSARSSSSSSSPPLSFEKPHFTLAPSGSGTSVKATGKRKQSISSLHPNYIGDPGPSAGGSEKGNAVGVPGNTSAMMEDRQPVAVAATLSG